MRLRFLRLLVFLLGALAAFGGHSQGMSEAQLKAAYLVNFLKYVEWPAQRLTANLCLVGRDSLGAALASYEGRVIGDAPVVVRRVASPEQAVDCHLLFIAESEDRRYSAILRWVDRQPVLTVSDGEGFLREGGGILLVRSDGRLAFEVNADALARAGLKPNSQMMRLARQVVGGGR